MQCWSDRASAWQLCGERRLSCWGCSDTTGIHLRGHGLVVAMGLLAVASWRDWCTVTFGLKVKYD